MVALFAEMVKLDAVTQTRVIALLLIPDGGITVANDCGQAMTLLRFVIPEVHLDNFIKTF